MAAHPDKRGAGAGGSYRRAMTISAVLPTPDPQCGQHRGSSPLTRARRSSAASITAACGAGVWSAARAAASRPAYWPQAKPVVAQALEAGRQHVAQEASDEGVGRQAHRTFAAGSVVAHPNRRTWPASQPSRRSFERHAVRCSGQGESSTYGQVPDGGSVDHPVVRQQPRGVGLAMHPAQRADRRATRRCGEPRRVASGNLPRNTFEAAWTGNGSVGRAPVCAICPRRRAHHR